jgi:hypothetical protein
LRQCLNKLTDPEFEGLIPFILSVPERNNLSKPISRIDILDTLERLDFLDKLESVLHGREEFRERLSDLLEQLQEVANATVDFVNRRDELQHILNESTPRAMYWIIDAPAGGGKSRFLQEIRWRYQNQGWVCCYQEIPHGESPSALDLANLIMSVRALGVSPFKDAFDPKQLGGEIAIRLLGAETGIEKVSVARKRGICIQLDNLEVLSDESLSELARLTSGIYEGLHASGFFDRYNKLRFFFAGRYIGRKRHIFESKANLVTAQCSLSPYSFEAIRETVDQYAAKTAPQESHLPNLSAHLMHLTGGHPKCIATILEEMATDHFARIPFMLGQYNSLRKDIISPTLKRIEQGIDSKVISIMETLSVFRKYNHRLLDILVGNEMIIWSDNVYQLEEVLTETNLLTRSRSFLQDDITRRLLAVRLRHRSPERFADLCSVGLKFYEDYFNLGSPLYPAEIAVEWLYQKLLHEYYANEQRGSELQQAMLDAIDYIFDLLVKKWDYREVIPSFLEILDEDWELVFLVNFLLRDDGFSNEQSRKLVIRVKDKYDLLSASSVDIE